MLLFSHSLAPMVSSPHAGEDRAAFSKLVNEQRAANPGADKVLINYDGKEMWISKEWHTLEESGALGGAGVVCHAPNPAPVPSLAGTHADLPPPPSRQRQGQNVNTRHCTACS